MTDAEIDRLVMMLSGMIGERRASPPLQMLIAEMARRGLIISRAASIAAGDLTGCPGIPEGQVPRPELVDAESRVEQLRGLLEGEPDGVGNAVAPSEERRADLPPGTMLAADYWEWQARLGVVPCEMQAESPPIEGAAIDSCDCVDGGPISCPPGHCVSMTMSVVRDGEVIWNQDIPLHAESPAPEPDIIVIADAPADSGPAPLTEAAGWIRGAMGRRKELWERVVNRWDDRK